MVRRRRLTTRLAAAKKEEKNEDNGALKDADKDWSELTKASQKTSSLRRRKASDDCPGCNPLMREIVAMERVLAQGESGTAEIEQYEKEIDAQPADVEILDEAKTLFDEEADIIQESLIVDVGKVDEPMDYTDQNTKMSSDDSLARQLISLAQALLEE